MSKPDLESMLGFLATYKQGAEVPVDDVVYWVEEMYDLKSPARSVGPTLNRYALQKGYVRVIRDANHNITHYILTDLGREAAQDISRIGADSLPRRSSGITPVQVEQTARPSPDAWKEGKKVTVFTDHQEFAGVDGVIIQPNGRLARTWVLDGVDSLIILLTDQEPTDLPYRDYLAFSDDPNYIEITFVDGRTPVRIDALGKKWAVALIGE